jgi:hypothetical protein
VLYSVDGEFQGGGGHTKHPNNTVTNRKPPMSASTLSHPYKLYYLLFSTT